ncbi:hypothetical protein E3N88_04327 [Mikania micrantha]|uniref:Uncharacterized protein n=1 Tax=Mikania micrantha TaxID=192012 RepID=A0A5N6PU33_9ASTR|nr:hypothetical protein E3N88_04327 [Mikania micrantha]
MHCGCSYSILVHDSTIDRHRAVDSARGAGGVTEEDPQEDPKDDPQAEPQRDPEKAPMEDSTEESSYRMPPRFRACKRPRFESDDIARLTWESKWANDQIEHMAQELRDEEEHRADIAEGRLIALEEQFVSEAEEEEEEIPAQDVDSDADSTIEDA